MGDYTDRIKDVKLVSVPLTGDHLVALDGIFIGRLGPVKPFSLSRELRREYWYQSSNVSWVGYGHRRKDAIDSLVWAAVHDPNRVDWTLTTEEER